MCIRDSADTAQGDHAANRLAFADLEAGNGFLGLGDHRLLARDLGQVAHGVVHDLLVGHSLRDTHVQRDLGQARNFHRRLVAELGHQFRSHFFAIVLLQSCHGHAALISSPLDL